MDYLHPLRTEELSFKNFYESTGFKTTDQPLTLEAFTKLVGDAEPEFRSLDKSPYGSYDRSLSELNFFSEQENVTAIQHLRYMPAVYHSSEFFELECVLKGQISCYIGNQKLILGAGDVLILAPGTNHAACVYDDNGIMANILVRKKTFEEHFMGVLPGNDILKGIFENALYESISMPYLLFQTREPDFLKEQLLPLLRECRHNSRYRNTMLIAQLSLFFVVLLRRHEKNVIIPTVNESVMNEETIFMLEYMQNNMATITLSHLASFFNYSERQVQRIIHTATGMSFVDNIKKLRMQKAAKLLLETNAKMSDIAEELGYYDVSSFRHAFRQFYGLSPKDYRDSGSGTDS